MNYPRTKEIGVMTRYVIFGILSLLFLGILADWRLQMIRRLYWRITLGPAVQKGWQDYEPGPIGSDSALTEPGPGTRLMSQEARADALAVLRGPCPACKIDHIGSCADAITPSPASLPEAIPAFAPDLAPLPPRLVDELWDEAPIGRQLAGTHPTSVLSTPALRIMDLYARLEHYHENWLAIQAFALHRRSADELDALQLIRQHAMA
jgi:hypothetical protein